MISNAEDLKTCAVVLPSRTKRATFASVKI